MDGMRYALLLNHSAVQAGDKLYHQSALDALRGEVERLRDALGSCREAGDKHVQRRCQMDDEIDRLVGEKTAAERRVADLESALRPLADATFAEFCSKKTERMEPDDSKVSYPEETCHITFGMIRNARKALAKVTP